MSILTCIFSLLIELTLTSEMHFVKFHPEVGFCLLSRGKRKNATLGMRLLWKYIRLKKKFCVSKLPPAFVLFFCAHLILQNSDIHFFFSWNYFFFHFYYEKRRKFAVLEEFKHVGAQKTCKIAFDFWKYGSWNFSVIFGFTCAWRQRPIEVKKK